LGPLRFDSADFSEMAGKTEGMAHLKGVAHLRDRSLALIKDDDFGITSAGTQIVIVKGTGIARR
jgi:hypothetical protein